MKHESQSVIHVCLQMRPVEGCITSHSVSNSFTSLNHLTVTISKFEFFEHYSDSIRTNADSHSH